MENTKIGNKECIALLCVITFNHLVISVTNSIINSTASASLLNILYISIIAIIFTSFICLFLSKFPTFDLVDISYYLGGNILKWIIGLLFIGYFIFFSGILLHLFSAFLQIAYFPYTKILFIVLLFLIASLICCKLQYNAIYRSTLIIFPMLVISILFLFFSNMDYYNIENIYPIWGYGINNTFLSGITNMFAFQALAYIYFLPPIMKDSQKIKKIAIISIIISAIFLLICVASILFMFDNHVDTDELVPLYYAVKYIQFGMFFQKLDSFFVLLWIMSLVNYLGITIKFCTNILKKLTKVENSSIFIYLTIIGLLFASIWPKNDAISTFFANDVYKYTFLVLVIGISFLILLLAFIKQNFRRKNE